MLYCGVTGLRECCCCCCCWVAMAVVVVMGMVVVVALAAAEKENLQLMRQNIQCRVLLRYQQCTFFSHYSETQIHILIGLY